MVDNSNIPFECFHSYGNMSSVLSNTLTGSYICCKGKNPESYDSIEHESTKQVFVDPLTKVLPPKSTWVLRKGYDFWITKGPKERLRSCFNTERCIVTVNLIVTDNCHDEARPTC